MADALPHRKAQGAAAAAFGEEARVLGRRVLTGATIAAAHSVVATVMRDSGGSPLDEAAGDVRTLRTDAGFNVLLERDLRQSMAAVTKLMLSAMGHGYESEAVFQTKAIVGLKVKVTGNDKAQMQDYPIQGHTCLEISRYMHDGLRYELAGMLAAPLVGDSNTGTLPSLMGNATERFGERCASAVEEAYFAGTQMAIRGVASALGLN